jgi:hypothetical protein
MTDTTITTFLPDTMSASEYRRLVVEPALKEEADDKEFFAKVTKLPKKSPKKPVMREDELTKKVANYLTELQMRGIVKSFSHIPASTFTRSWGVKMKNKAMGVKPGVPDMLIVFESVVLFLELKRKKGGRLSEFQREWIENLKATGKVEVRVACGWDEAKDVLDFFSSF